jgi:hypothetical protein
MMEEPMLGEIRGGDYARRVAALAGALAESAVTQIAMETDDADQLVELDARAADLPGLLADPGRLYGLHVRARTLISVTPRAVAWVTHDPVIDEAMRRARAALP